MTSPEAPTPPETIEVETLEQFASIMSGWHGNRIQRLRHMISIPLGSKVQVDDGKHLLMKGNLRKGFILGLQIAIGELGTLPFAAQYDEPKADQQ